MNADEIIRVMERAKELGLKQVKCDGFEASFEDLKFGTPVMVVPDAKSEDIMKPLSVFEEPSEEEVLYWATPYYDELMAQKEEHNQKLNSELKEREANG